jgi:hypothetical protein
MKQFGHIACNDCVIKARLKVLDCYEISILGSYRCDLCRTTKDTSRTEAHSPTRRAMRELWRALGLRTKPGAMRDHEKGGGT